MNLMHTSTQMAVLRMILQHLGISSGAPGLRKQEKSILKREHHNDVISVYAIQAS